MKPGISSLRRLRAATILLVSSFAVLVVAAGVYNLTQQYNVVIDSTTRAARNTAKAAESHATQTFGETYRILQGIADVYEFQLELAAQKKTAFDEAHLHKVLAEKLSTAPAVSTFFVLDENYTGVAASRRLPVDLSRVYISGISFDGFTEVGEDLVLGQLYKDQGPTAPKESWLLPLGAKVKDKDGILRGFVFAILRARFFSDYYATLDIGPNGRIALWADDGRLIAATPNEKVAIGDIRKVEAVAQTEPSGDFVYTTGTDLAQEVIARDKIGALPLTASIVLDAEDFLLPWRTARNAVSFAVAVIVLAMAVFALIILRQIKRTEENERALRQAKAAAEEANEAKSSFLAHMSHEFRTPLNAIMGFSEIIKNKVLGEGIAPAYTSYADHIHRSGEHLLNIVNDILDMAKIESGAQPLQREAIDIPGVIAAGVSFVEGLATQKRVRIRAAIAPQLPSVSGDERFSRQVVINLLSNAIKFSSPDSEIVISTVYAEGKFLDIAVSDHGPGIEPALLKRLGEPFLQGNPSVSHSGQGTGLGLSICKRYMDLLGGELIIDSTVGSGTTATIRFPHHLLIPPGKVRSVA
jgi:two-component system cell cycle sensor histidine kinase PleC